VFTVESLGRYLMHDIVHHLVDVEQGFAALGVDRPAGRARRPT
jgi:hypothetical protein